MGVSGALVADVTVKDLASGGTTVMTSALSYAAPVPTLNIRVAPSGTVFIGDTAPFTVQAIAADGVTALVNQSITFTATGAGAIFGACAAASCSVLTDANGIASITVIPQSPGDVTLAATGIAGTQTDVFSAAARVRTVTALNPEQYVAAGASVVWNPRVALADNSASTIGVRVSWSGALVTPSVSITDAQSVAQAQATAGPLTAGGEATITACAWISACTNFTAIGVDDSQLQIVIVSGEGQSIAATGTLSPVVLRVTDAESHPVAGALVEIHQTLDAWQAPCPDHGRCPVPAVYGTSTTSEISDANGLVAIVPMQIAGVPGVTSIAAASGPNGFVSLALQQQP
jgi:hypothetical protein